MKCLYCNFPDTSVVETKTFSDATIVKRRRKCKKCNRKFTTLETVLRIPMYVIKHDNTREVFNREKIYDGIKRACEKRPVSMNAIEKIVEDICNEIEKEYILEVPSSVIGEKILEKLKKTDKVAYIRFASVFKRFSKPEDFINEIKNI
ncbi:MAG: transcriptional regulator NrdR [bacterium]|nr:transcriptional regulator NrdR [bacterium]